MIYHNMSAFKSICVSQSVNVELNKLKYPLLFPELRMLRTYICMIPSDDGSTKQMVQRFNRLLVNG